MIALINKLLDWFKALFWKEEMELTLVGLQYSGKTTFVNVIAVREERCASASCAVASVTSIVIPQCWGQLAVVVNIVLIADQSHHNIQPTLAKRPCRLHTAAFDLSLAHMQLLPRLHCDFKPFAMQMGVCYHVRSIIPQRCPFLMGSNRTSAGAPPSVW